MTVDARSQSATMETIFRLLLITTACGLFSMVRGKCAPTPLVGGAEITNAYVCVNGNLSDVDAIPSNAEWIEFTVSRINDLPSNAFARFTKLRRLTFYNCVLRGLSDEAFQGLNNLEWLVMSNTRIDAARAAQFRHLTSLRRLTLDGAGLVYIEPEVFHGLEKLETLSLRDNDLDCLPIEALGALKSLKTVQIGKNPWLCDCRYSMDEFFAARAIEHGPSDEQCVAENYDGETRPYRKKVPECMTILDYPDLPEVVSKDQGTAEPPRQGGRFEWRESVAGGIESLDRLPDEITWIQMFDVPLPILRRYTFFRFGNTLRSVELRNCGIEKIERESFAGLHKLERLYLVGNRLFTLGHEWFRDLARLTDLVLRHNEIENIDENALIHLGSLRVLDLTKNRLTCLSQHHLRGLVSLQKLQATDNPWLCQCRNELEHYLTGMRIGYEINSGRCHLPGEMTSEQPRYNNRTSWISTTSTNGIIRWSWAYEIHRPSMPVPIRPSITYFPPPVASTTTSRPLPRPGGCHIIHRTGRQEGKIIESCVCTRASLVDLIEVPANLEAIVYSGSIIPTIHNDAFRKFGRYLKRLELRECGIQRIERRAFYNLRILESLVIRGNDLEIIRSEWFDEMRNLRRLDISRNGITRISNGVYDSVPYLVALDVSENRLNCIGIEHLEALDYLRELEITGNPWTCLCVTKLVQLMKEKHIACKCNPDALLLTDEGGWGCEGGARYYPVRGTTPAIISTTSTTTTTTMRPWSPIPQPTITDAPVTWPISGTCYQSQDTASQQHEGGTSRAWYHCANGDINMLLRIPSYITRIEIIDSYVPRLTAMAFARFENLTELVLRNCTLREIDVRAFAGLNKLEKLTLRDNRFIAVKNGWFDETRNLVWLDLSDNYLADIEDGALDGLDELEYLNLEGNAFKCLYTSCFVALPRLKSLEFGRNPLKWRCWQEIRQFLEIRAIGYTYHKCPHSGKDLVRNLLKDDNTRESQLVNAARSIALVQFTFTKIFIFIVCISSWLV